MQLFKKIIVDQLNFYVSQYTLPFPTKYQNPMSGAEKIMEIPSRRQL